jgi:hypothetical protein
MKAAHPDSQDPAMSSKSFKIVTLIASLIPACLRAAEDYSAWSRKAKLRFDTSPSGAAVDGTVRDFPLLVRLNGQGFDFSQAALHGEDIRFAGADGKPLAYQIERWDRAAAAAEIWVRMDSIPGNAAGSYIRMYWGNASASDSSKGAAVFASIDGYEAAWHLGGTGPRPNAVAGGSAAVPSGYSGGESVRGVIGLADSLKGGSPGGYLDLGDGYDGFAAGFTFSAWVYCASATWYAHILDLGNGQTADNIVLQRFDTTRTAAFDNYQGSEKSNSVHVDGGMGVGKWQYLAVAVKGKDIRYYVDGALAATDTLSIPISGAFRTENFLGKSNWAGDNYFQGVIDEAELAKAERGADWIKLSYESQRPDSRLITFSPESDCASRFAVAADTLISEGRVLQLAGTALCATEHSWTAIEGPAPRILDPEAETLLVVLPRVDKDTVIRYRFSADFGDSAVERNVAVRIRNDVPDPVFTLPASFAWNGKGPLSLKPDIANLAALLASIAPDLHYGWTAGGWSSDQATPDADGLLQALSGDDRIPLELCLDNGGKPVCRVTELILDPTVVGIAGPAGRALGNAKGTPGAGFDAMGRRSGTGRERAGMRFRRASHFRGADRPR